MPVGGGSLVEGACLAARWTFLNTPFPCVETGSGKGRQSGAAEVPAADTPGLALKNVQCPVSVDGCAEAASGQSRCGRRRPSGVPRRAGSGAAAAAALPGGRLQLFCSVMLVPSEVDPGRRPPLPRLPEP